MQPDSPKVAALVSVVFVAVFFLVAGWGSSQPVCLFVSVANFCLVVTGWTAWFIRSRQLDRLESGIASLVQLTNPASPAASESSIDSTLEALRNNVNIWVAQRRIIFEKAHDGICSIGEDQRVISANKACEKLFGCSLEQLIGHPVTPFIVVAQSDSISRTDNARSFAELLSEQSSCLSGWLCTRMFVTMMVTLNCLV